MIDLLDIKVDIVFKDFFGDKSSKELLESFINSVLGFEGDDLIEIEEFLDPRKMRVEVGRPSTFVDLSVKTRGGERYIIEMQTYNHEGFDKRLLYYLGKDYTEQIDYHHHQQAIETERQKKQKKLVGWQDLPKVHIVAIIDFHRSEREKNGILNDEKVVETYRFKPEFSSSNEHLFNQWKATLVDLKKFKDKPLKELKTHKEKWFYLLKNASLIKEKEASALKQDPVFQRALERLERLSSDPATRKAYEASINEHRDHLAVLSSERKAGRKEEKLEIAQALLKQGLPLSQIAEATGLLIEEVKSLR
ncbi:Rpn family recombination-promoting nuclease/putative transposase [Candidatus Neptunochlamydia vexilliferae]|nr:Rpn family recombination-promoting nuclease/putative transposase [Candidatus Neptunochlamydia vexilliferae]